MIIELCLAFLSLLPHGTRVARYDPLVQVVDAQVISSIRVKKSLVEGLSNLIVQGYFRGL